MVYTVEEILVDLFVQPSKSKSWGSDDHGWIALFCTLPSRSFSKTEEIKAHIVTFKNHHSKIRAVKTKIY